MQGWTLDSGFTFHQLCFSGHMAIVLSAAIICLIKTQISPHTKQETQTIRVILGPGLKLWPWGSLIACQLTEFKGMWLACFSHSHFLTHSSKCVTKPFHFHLVGSSLDFTLQHSACVLQTEVESESHLFFFVFHLLPVICWFNIKWVCSYLTIFFTQHETAKRQIPTISQCHSHNL